jgi:hypothetical protein
MYPHPHHPPYGGGYGGGYYGGGYPDIDDVPYYQGGYPSGSDSYMSGENQYNLTINYKKTETEKDNDPI